MQKQEQRKENRPVFPFTAILGQDTMKQGLILNVIDPKIGGVLVFGEKGTAKSTAIRALARLLPKITAVKGCPFHCDPGDVSTMCEACREQYDRGESFETEIRDMQVAELPVSATEDRVVGSLDLEEAVRNGKKKFDLGVLAKANRGILYVDEINLLDDHLVDLLLDCAAMGVNTMEREGISFSHPANFILIGTMNPEEGELRPQLLDRFGFCVGIKGIQDPEERIEIIKRCAAFGEDPEGFCIGYRSQEETLAEKISAAKNRLAAVEIPDEVLWYSAKIAISLGVDGHRGDLTMVKALRALAAWEGRSKADKDDILRLVQMVFSHRMKSLPLEQDRKLELEQVKRILDEG